MAAKRPKPYVEDDPLIEWLAWLMDNYWIRTTVPIDFEPQLRI